MALSEARKRANKKWNDVNMSQRYDRLNILVPKGQKATIQAAADEAGESINQYTNKALLARLGREEWPEIEPDN